MTPDLYQQLTNKLLLTGSTLIPELIAMIADEKEAKRLLSMPGTPEALVLEADAAPVHPDFCMGGGLCASTCPEGAITLITARPTDFIPGAAAP